ncbi:(3S,6E)-nerolidol synthase 1, chloroplastic [Linum perenne]
MNFSFPNNLKAPPPPPKDHSHHPTAPPHHITMHSRRLLEARVMFNQMEQYVQEDKSTDIMLMIDALQRLGLDHHFHHDISTVLKEHYYYYLDTDQLRGGHDLFHTSLRFRLLRQQGYRISSDVFDKFRDDKEVKLGEYSDMRGLMELYEASFWATTGETLMDEAAEFNTQMMLQYCSTHHLMNCSYSLSHPFHRNLPKFHIKKYLNISHPTTCYNHTLTDLMKLDFNINQSIYREEVNLVSKWWKELGLAEDLRFARNEPVKWYMWPLAVLTDPKLSEERVELTKPISFVYLIDDIFDVYGSLDELILFTQIVNKWDILVAEQLPDYMRKCFIALHGVTNQFANKVYKRHGCDPINSLQQAWAKLLEAFLVEAKWFKSGERPNAEEYLQNGIVSSGVQVVLVHLFFLLGDGLTQRNMDLVNGYNPPVISSVAKLLRLSDDLSATNEEEHHGDDGSYVDYYMKEHPESTVQSAREHVMEMIEETWKEFNEECLSSATKLPLEFTRAAHNSAKMIPLMYVYEGKGDDDERILSIEDHMKSMLFETIPM